MKVAYFDCPSGAAGDMILGALVDAGVPFETLRDRLAALHFPGYMLERREVMKGAFRATKIEVRVHDDTGHGHPHRDLPAILGIIDAADLAAPVKEAASRIFRRLAEAEGRAHGMPPERVQFHDVGAVDAIVDVIGSCIGLDWLEIDTIHCSALPIGGGIVRGPHGVIPVPAPGTAELLKGFPVVDTGVKRELVTPTGAAILTTLAARAGAMPAMTVTSVGYGAGTMDLETPNVLRVFIGETMEREHLETIVQVETTVDDMSPQLYEPLMERLFEAGALDVYLTPVLMKKSRPGVVVTALCEPGGVTALTRACFEESTTIGVRWTTYQRQRLPREIVTLSTSLGALSYKVSRLDGRVVTVTPEFDEVRRIAREKGLAVRDALEQARTEGRRLMI
ncbi:MAG TPA: nickel pincer cofactor biosynthesis protein LarC [Candidatus Methylomirabilis sp.]|nr:nickel pincer cofactor biosynthesis protein LarC [Candidatus Methylomirabilis sp.]